MGKNDNNCRDLKRLRALILDHKRDFIRSHGLMAFLKTYHPDKHAKLLKKGS